MVFHPEGQFQQFPHCKFRENIVRLLYIPSILPIGNGPEKRQTSTSVTLTDSNDDSNEPYPHQYNFLAVNKFGKVGLYHPERFTLLHTYCLDLSVPMHPRGLRHSLPTTMNNPPTPKCERTHLVTDATFSPETFCVIFATTKNLLQWYDIGEIQQQNIGLEIFPRKEFLSLYESSFPTNVANMGHVESHRLFGLTACPNALEYSMKKLFVGDVEGAITIISISNPRAPMGRRKIRGKLHKIILSDLTIAGIVRSYKAHHHPVTDIFFLREKDLVLSCSKDKKFSVFVKDITDIVDNIIVSIPKGVNSLAYSRTLKMIATGSDDHVVRLFSQFIMKMPQMELFGHRSPVITVQFVRMDCVVVDGVQEENAVILLSYSTDSELRAWDPMTFICLQSFYISFPVGSTIMCKTPEFSRKSLLVLLQKESSPPALGQFEKIKKPKPGSVFSKRRAIRPSNVSRNKNGTIILLYCNSYAKISLVKDGPTRWPFDYDGFIQEYEELSTLYDKKLKEKLNIPKTTVPLINIPLMEEDDEKEEEIGGDEYGIGQSSIRDKKLTPSPSPPSREIKLSKEEVTEIESKLDKYLNDILELKQAIRGKITSGAQSEYNGKHLLTNPDLKTGISATPSGSNTGRSTMEADEDQTSSAVHFNISVEATKKYYQFKRDKGKGIPKDMRRLLSYGQAFNQYPILELEPVQFTRRNLRIPEKMKSMLGIDSVNSVQDLFTPEAQAYFGVHQGKGKGTPSRGNSARNEGSRSAGRHNHFAVVGHKIHNAYEEETCPSSSVRSSGRAFPPLLEEDEDDKSFDFS